MKLKSFAPLLTIGAFLMFMPSEMNVLASLGYGGGSGTESDPYLISTPEHLNQLQLDVNVNGINTTGKYYRLTTNIDLAGYDNDSDETNGNFTPIGNSSVSFKGTFDGDGYVVSNLEIILPEQDYVGFFGYLSSGIVQDVGMENILVKGKQRVGGLVGGQTGSSSLINNSHVAGNVVGGGNNVGGLVGWQSYGEINQSYASVEIEGGGKYIGGLVGYQSYGTINQSYSTGNVVGNSDYIGGLVGYQASSSASKILQSYAAGSVSGGRYVGGLVGYQDKGIIRQSYAIGSVSGSNHLGGLIGYQGSSSVTVENSYWDIEVSGQSSSKGGYPIRTGGLISGLSYYVFEGFDFENTWVLCEGKTPQLRWNVDGCQEVERSNFSIQGDGTEENPYLISTPEHLIEISKLIYYGGLYPSKSYKLANDIDLSGCDTDEDDSNGNFIPLGSNEIDFQGVFDGNGYTISNVKLVLPNQDYVGFFGSISSAMIQNLGLKNILVEGKQYVGGLVGYQYSSSSVISGNYVMGNVSGSGNNVGGLVGYQGYGTIQQNYVIGEVTGSGKHTGGLVGYVIYGKINQSYTTGSIVGNENVGGLVGYQGSSSKILQSYATGSVTGAKTVGGLVGNQDKGSISESYSTVNVIGTKTVGGLVGYQSTSLVVENSYWDVETSGQSSSKGGYPIRTSGLISGLSYYAFEGFDFENTWVLCEGKTPQLRWNVDGCQEVERSNFSIQGDGTEENPYLISTPEHLIEVSKLIYYGGLYPSKSYKLTNDISLFGYDTDENESNGNWIPLGSKEITFKGMFDGSGYVVSNLKIILPEQDYVGFFGSVESTTIQNIGLENVLVEGNQYVGGLVGSHRYGMITHSYVVGNINGHNKYVGGFVGSQYSGSIEQSYATGSVSGDSEIVGGFVGYLNLGSIKQSYSTGSVSGSVNIGGFVGYQGSSAYIGQSYSTGSVSGSNYVGGFVGYQNSGTIEESYATGKLSGNSTVGGFVARKTDATTVRNSYWDVECSGRNHSYGGTGLTTKQMTKREAKENMSGFDFDIIWQESNGYPLLHWQPADPIREEDIIVNGFFEATILSLTVPTNSIGFVLNPNEEVGKQFVASGFELTIESRAPLTIELRAFEQVSDVLNDVVPTKYNDWNGLNQTESKDFALALVPKTSDGWLSLNEGNRWVANLGETMIGTIKGDSTVSFGFEAKHGSSFTETLTPQYKLSFVFGLQD